MSTHHLLALEVRLAEVLDGLLGHHGDRGSGSAGRKAGRDGGGGAESGGEGRGTRDLGVLCTPATC